MTPLIDVVFILLVFFMLVSSFLDWRTIALSSAGPRAAAADARPSVLVELHADGLRLDGRPVGAEALVAAVRTRLSALSDGAVLVRPAGAVTLQDTVALLDRLAAGGVGEVRMIKGPER